MGRDTDQISKSRVSHPADAKGTLPGLVFQNALTANVQTDDSARSVAAPAARVSLVRGLGYP